MKSEQKDHTTLERKIALRRTVLQQIKDPVILETHGGTGEIFKACYRDVQAGVVFEKNADKAALLAVQRPTWSVYEAACEPALLAGVGGHLAVNLLDVDPYGEPWPTIDAFLFSERELPARFWIVVNDGLRQKVRYGGAWNVESLAEAVAFFGNHLFPIYLDVCEWLLRKKAEKLGRRRELLRFHGYYCGTMSNVTHYAALFGPQRRRRKSSKVGASR